MKRKVVRLLVAGLICGMLVGCDSTKENVEIDNEVENVDIVDGENVTEDDGKKKV